VKWTRSEFAARSSAHNRKSSSLTSSVVNQIVI
jgi:hypothetical protein